MAARGMMEYIIIENDTAFSVHLGVPKNVLKMIGKPVLAGMGGFALAVFALSNPIGIGLTVATVAAGGSVILDKIPKKTQQGKKFFHTPLSQLGVNVANLVFFPVLGMAFSDGKVSPTELEFIKDEMKDWGYATQYIDTFIEEKKKRLEEIYKRKGEALSLLSQEFSENKKNALDNDMGIKPKDVDFAKLDAKTIELCEKIRNEEGVILPSNQKYLEYLKKHL
jgi:hypothetical protein